MNPSKLDRQNRWSGAIGAAVVAAAALALPAAEQSVKADVIAYYDFNNLSGTVTANQVTPVSGSALGFSSGGFTALTSVGGTTINVIGADTAGAALSGTGSATGYYQFEVNLTGYSDPVVTFAAQRSSTAGATLTGLYSTDGTNFATLSPADTVATTFASSGVLSYSFVGVGALSGQSTAYFRFMDSGGSATGTLRIDNVQINATSASSTPSDVAISASTNSLNLGRFISGQTVGSSGQTLTLTKSGTQAGAYTVAGTGGVTASTGSFGAGAGSSVVAISAPVGIVSGSLTFHDAATTSAGAGQGSADPDDTVNVAGTSVANRQIGSATPTATGSANVIGLGKVIVGATASGSGTVTTVGDDNSNTEVTLLGNKYEDFTGTIKTTSAGVTTTSTAYTIHVATGPSDILFNSSAVTAPVTGTAVYYKSGVNTAAYGQFVSSTSSSAGTALTNAAIKAEGLAGESVKTADVIFSATVLDPSNGAADAAGDKNVTINLGTFTQGSGTQSIAEQLYDIIAAGSGTVGANTAGLDLYASATSGSSNVSGDFTGLATALVGTPSTFHVNVDTTTAGDFTTTLTLNVGDEVDAQGATVNSTPVNYTFTGTVTGASAVPEPASLSVLGCGAAALLARRRRR